MKDKETYGIKKTWLNYYWYYYKWHIFFILFFGIGIVLCAVQCATKINPDSYVLFYSNSFSSDQQLNEIAEKMEQYIVDINDDGETLITAINCTYPQGNSTRKSRVSQQALLQIQNADTHIWVLDENGIETYLLNDNIDIFGTHPSFDGYNKMAISADKIPALKDLTNSGKKYYLLCRKNENGKLTEQAEKILENLIEQ